MYMISPQSTFHPEELEEGKIYIIDDIEVGEWNTRVWLEDVANPEGGFNSVMFANAEDYF